MRCTHPNCHESMEYWPPTKDEADTGAKAMPAGWYCPYGHYLSDEDAPDPRELHGEIYGVEPAFLEMDGPMVPMEDER